MHLWEQHPIFNWGGGGGAGRQVLKFGFGRDMPLQNMKGDPANTNFSWKSDPFIYKSVQFWAKSWRKFFFEDFWNLSQFWLKFIYQILHFIRGHSYTKRLILLPMLMACLRRSFVLSTPLSTLPSIKCAVMSSPLLYWDIVLVWGYTPPLPLTMPLPGATVFAHMCTLTGANTQVHQLTCAEFVQMSGTYTGPTYMYLLLWRCITRYA